MVTDDIQLQMIFYRFILSDLSKLQGLYGLQIYSNLFRIVIDLRLEYDIATLQLPLLRRGA